MHTTLVGDSSRRSEEIVKYLEIVPFDAIVVIIIITIIIIIIVVVVVAVVVIIVVVVLVGLLVLNVQARFTVYLEAVVGWFVNVPGTC